VWWISYRGEGTKGVENIGVFEDDGSPRKETDSHFKCDTKSLVGVVPTVKEGTTRVTG